MGTLSMCTSRTLLGCLGLFFFLFGLACVAIGSLIINRYYDTVEFIHNFDIMKVPAVLLILVGLIFFLAGICGCCNLFRTNKGCLGTFFVFLLAVVVLLIVSASLGTVYRDHIDNELTHELNKSMQSYNSSSEAKLGKKIDDLQQYFKCCGISNFSDWLHTTFGRVPQSCTDNTTGVIFPEGCYKKVQNFFDKNFGYVIGGAVGLLIILILGMVGSCVLFHYKKDDSYFTLS